MNIEKLLHWPFINPISSFVYQKPDTVVGAQSGSSALTHPNTSSPQRKSRQLNIPNMNPIISWLWCIWVGCIHYRVQPPESKKERAEVDKERQTNNSCSVLSLVPLISVKKKLCPILESRKSVNEFTISNYCTSLFFLIKSWNAIRGKLCSGSRKASFKILMTYNNSSNKTSRHGIKNFINSMSWLLFHTFR